LLQAGKVDVAAVLSAADTVRKAAAMQCLAQGIRFEL